MNHAALKVPAAMESRRNRLLDAAPRLAELFTLDQLKPDIVAEAASLTEADFNAEFASVGHYLGEVHTRFMEFIRARLLREAGDLKPGLERILRAAGVQLDICLEQRALRNWLAEARRKIALVANDLHMRNRAYSMMISLELSNIGCKQSMSMVVARLFCQMILEAAQIEADAGAKMPEVRQALHDFLAMWLPVKPAAG